MRRAAKYSGSPNTPLRLRLLATRLLAFGTRADLLPITHARIRAEPVAALAVRSLANHAEAVIAAVATEGPPCEERRSRRGYVESPPRPPDCRTFSGVRTCGQIETESLIDHDRARASTCERSSGSVVGRFT